MARPLRIEFEGALYHVTSLGNARQAIFLDDEDRERFLERLGKVVDRFGWLCHAYCLMTNHYHLLLETPAANLSRGMQLLNGTFTQAFNRRHGRVGHCPSAVLGTADENAGVLAGWESWWRRKATYSNWLDTSC